MARKRVRPIDVGKAVFARRRARGRAAAGRPGRRGVSEGGSVRAGGFERALRALAWGTAAALVASVGMWFAVERAASDAVPEQVGGVSTGTVEAASLPSWFADEVMDVGAVPDARDVRMDDRGRVVGFVVPRRAADAFADASARLEGKGWVAVQSDAEGFGTFVKQHGACRWVSVMCVGVGDGASVVMQTDVREGEVS